MASAKSTRRGERVHGGCLMSSRVSLAVVSGPVSVGIVLTSQPCVSQRQLSFGAQLVSLTTRRQAREGPAVLLTAGVSLCATAACKKTLIW